MSKLETEFEPLYTEWTRQRTPQTSGALLRALQPTIDRGLNMHLGRNNIGVTSRSRARRLALQAMDTYDPARAKLQTHVINHLRGLRRPEANIGLGAKLPDRTRRLLAVMQSANQELEDELGREPSLLELSAKTGLSGSRLAQLQQLRYPRSSGSLQGTGEEGGDWSPSVQQQGPDSSWTQVVYLDLSGTDRKIMEWTLGLFGNPTLSNQEIAQRLHLSPGAISQRKALIQQKLDEGQRYSPFQ